jgi:hypothetical protein
MMMIRVRSQIGARSKFVATQNTTFACAAWSMMNAEHDSLAMFDTTNAITCGLSRASAFEGADPSVDENGPVDLHSQNPSRVVTEFQTKHQNIVMMGTFRYCSNNCYQAYSTISLRLDSVHLYNRN